MDNVGQLVEAFVHEATHTVISRIELYGPLVNNHAQLQGKESLSPWSGDMLLLYAFLPLVRRRRPILVIDDRSPPSRQFNS